MVCGISIYMKKKECVGRSTLFSHCLNFAICFDKFSGLFKDNRYWDVVAEYAKASPNDVLCKYTFHNRGPDTATIHVLPQLWYRNTWIWGCTHEASRLLVDLEVKYFDRLYAHCTMLHFMLINCGNS